MVSAVWAFLSSPLGRWIAGLAAALILVAGLSFWHGRAVTRLVDDTRTEAVNARDEIWRGKLQAAESAARDTIRRKEEAAYRRGIDDEAKRRAADAADAEKTETIIREVTHASPSAASCRFDDPAVAGLNRLRRGQD